MFSMYLRLHLLRLGFSSGQVKKWLAVARTASVEGSCFSTINTLLDTTNEGTQTVYVPEATLKTSTDLFNRQQEEASLRGKLNAIKEAIKSFVSDYSGSVEQGYVEQHQESHFDPINNEAMAVVRHESQAELAQIESEERYTDWIAQQDEASSGRKTIFRDVFRQDYRKRFDEAGQSSRVVLSWNLTTFSARNLRQQCSDLHATRLSFANHLSGGADVCPMSTVLIPFKFKDTKGACSRLLSAIKMSWRG